MLVSLNSICSLDTILSDEPFCSFDPCSSCFFGAYFRKICPRVIGFKLLDELVICLSVLLTATSFLLPSFMSEIIATFDASNSGADSVTFILLVCVRTGALVAVSNLLLLLFMLIWSKCSKSSLDEFVLIVSLICCIRLLLAESSFFFVLLIFLTLAMSKSSLDFIVRLKFGCSA